MALRCRRAQFLGMERFGAAWLAQAADYAHYYCHIFQNAVKVLPAALALKLRQWVRHGL